MLFHDATENKCMMQGNSILVCKIIDVGLCTPLPLKDLIGEVDRVILCCYQRPPCVDDGDQRGSTSTVGLAKKTFYADYCVFHLYFFGFFITVHTSFKKALLIDSSKINLCCCNVLTTCDQY